MATLRIKHETPEKPQMLLIGCGSAGRNIASLSRRIRRLTIDGGGGADFPVDRSTLAVAEMEPSMIRTASPAFYSRLGREVEGAHAVMIVGGLGGFAGGIAAAAVSRAGRALGIPVIASVALPFDVEGSVRRASARKSLDDLERTASITIPFENNIINQTMSNVRISRALDIMNRIVLSPLEEIALCADSEFLDSLARSHYRGRYAVSYSSGMDWEKKGAHGILSELGEQSLRFMQIHVFLSINSGWEDSAERLGSALLSKAGECDVTVWVKNRKEEAQNRIGAIALY
jgi:hypothetical protein